MKTPLILLVISLMSCTTIQIDPAQFEDVTDANNSFGLNLLLEEHQEKPSENIFISPLSVYSALAMTANGASGQTLSEMENTLQFDGVSLSDMNAQYEQLITQLESADKKVEFTLANSIWYKDEFSVSPAFLNSISGPYQAEITSLDFSDPKAKDEINDWVRKETNGKIESIVDEITPAHVMFLVNALFFEGKWTEGFKESDTRDRTFTLEDNTAITVPQMASVETEYLVHRNEEVSLTELPYKEDGFSLVLVKPEGGTVDQLLQSMSMDDLTGWIDELTLQEISLRLPKMTIEYESLLNQSLQDLGIQTAFQAGRADFSNLGEGELSISKVLHKTYLEVDESGTTAAAATSVGVVATSFTPTVNFFYDSPFLIFLRHRESGLILFSGKIMDPRS